MTTLLPLVFAVVILAAAVTAALLRRARGRSEDLANVAAALSAHYDALARILDDPAVSDQMKDSLHKFHLGVMDRQIAASICKKLVKEGLRGNGEPFPFDSEINTLERTRKDLFRDIQTVTHTGLVILLLRWPETAAYFKSAVVALSSRSGGAEFANEVIRRERKMHTHDLPPTPMAA